ncbi:hypothetical protein GY45DRAFT_320850 [Cubamyces sp. BRFM 1775]|nr:hypothetical protein GY45DRAFT_320850 [Cubamyces sp. BRFM 1775]
MPTLDTQDLVPGLAKTLRYRRLKLDSCSGLGAILALDQGPEVKPVGVSMRLSGKGVITAVALATETTVLQLNMEGLTAGSNAQSSTNALAALLGRSDCLLAGIGMPRIALLLRHQHQADGHAIDLPLLHKNMVKEGLPSPGILAKELLGQGALEFKINALWYRDTNDALCLRAWLSACIASKSKNEILASLKLRTHHLPTSHLQCLSVIAMNIELLEAMKPTQMQNEFKDVFVTKGGEIRLLNSRFKSRVRKSRQTRVEFNDGKMIARPVGATGKHTTLTISGGRVRAKEITHIRVLGREEATCAELARDFFITQILQGEMVLDVSPFVRMLWFPNRQKNKKAKKPATDEQFASLNDSQRRVAAEMIADGEPLVIAHGPPGTGKTSTIAAALKYWQDAKQAVWVVAQSNVGVKNIARSIVKKHINFRLIVSKEFHFEWHEHLYTTVEDKIIRSDELFGTNFDPVHRIGKAKIILSTLSMLSNPWMVTSGIYAHCPVQYLVVDEASQIDTVEFMHLFDKFDKLDRLHKVCMFGDPEQRSRSPALWKR